LDECVKALQSGGPFGLPGPASILIAVELPGLLPQNALILLAGNPECPGTLREHLLGFSENQPRCFFLGRTLSHDVKRDEKAE
jgi:hypothetical protein